MQLLFTPARLCEFESRRTVVCGCSCVESLGIFGDATSAREYFKSDLSIGRGEVWGVRTLRPILGEKLVKPYPQRHSKQPTKNLRQGKLKPSGRKVSPGYEAEVMQSYDEQRGCQRGACPGPGCCRVGGTERVSFCGLGGAINLPQSDKIDRAASNSIRHTPSQPSSSSLAQLEYMSLANPAPNPPDPWDYSVRKFSV